jgi:hypothetical protein
MHHPIVFWLKWNYRHLPNPIAFSLVLFIYFTGSLSMHWAKTTTLLQSFEDWKEKQMANVDSIPTQT